MGLDELTDAWLTHDLRRAWVDPRGAFRPKWERVMQASWHANHHLL